jgi:Flp pilus assembly protein TadD
MIGVLGAAGCAASAPPADRPPAERIAALETRLQRDSTDVRVLVPLALAHGDASDFDRAAALLYRALQRDPGNVRASLALASVYERAGRYAEARAAYANYLRLERAPAAAARARNRLVLLDHLALIATAREALEREAELAATPPRPGTVAVFPFRYLGTNAEYRPLGTALAEMLVTDLAIAEQLTLLERSQVQHLLDEIRVGEQGRVDPATGARNGRMLGAEHVVQGSLDGDAEALRLIAAVVGVGPEPRPVGRPIGEEAAARRLIEMQKRVALGVFAALGVELTAEQQRRFGVKATESLPALLAFGQGLESFDRGQFSEALGHFRRAQRHDPGFAAVRERAQQAGAALRAASLSPQQVVAAADRPQSTDVESMMRGFGERDAITETLRQEGLTPQSAVLRVIIRAP